MGCSEHRPVRKGWVPDGRWEKTGFMFGGTQVGALPLTTSQPEFQGDYRLEYVS